ncbi:MAG: efflux RND transporter permease subunit [Cellvibrio sp.]|uniref:efflux RND transporter permease subunit n=1 Tax=Cellvibrio sp. TaxID=1965322 RepID=UPI0031B13E42
MNLNISSWSIANPVATSLLFILLTLAGLGGFWAMKVQNFPDIEFPIITITAALPGASPPQLETDVARRIEDVVANTQGIKHISSSLTDGVATITAEFRIEKNVQEAMDDVRDAVSSIRANLPADLLDPVITKLELASTPIMTYTVSSSRLDDESLSWLVDNQITRQLMSVSGVGAVARVGGVNREIRVELDPDKLLAMNISAADISQKIRQLQLESSGGRVDLGGAEQSVRTIATVKSVHEIASMDVSLGDGRRIRLDQVANVIDTNAEQRSLALINGKHAVGFDILRARGAGEVAVADATALEIQKLKAAHPDVEFTEAVNFVEPVRENYSGSMMLLYEGALLAILVVFFFLRDWRATLIASVALPLSVIPTFAVIHLLGFSLNTVSLLSLPLVIGVLVDDAIVEIENIERHLLMGKSPYTAARDASNEIGLAVIATSLTLIAVFLPTSMMGGIVGKYFFQFGWTASIAVFFSLLVARMLTPMMAAFLLKATAELKSTGQPVNSPRWIEIYLRYMRICLAHRRLTLAAVLLFVVSGFLTAAQLPGEFIPQDESNQTQVTLSLPPGSKLQDTLAIAEQARAVMQKNPQVESIYTAIGVSTASGDPDEASGPAGVTSAVLTANLTHRNDRAGIRRQDIESQLRNALTILPGTRVSVGMGGNSEGYEIVLASEDGPLLAQHASLVERELRSIPGIGAVTSSASLIRPELVIRPDFARAADLGVTTASIAETVRIATAGDYDQLLAKLNLSERQIPIVVRLANNGRDDIDTLRRLPVPGVKGPVPLESVAELEMLTGPAELTRYDRMRNININVELNGLVLSDVENAAAALPALQKLPQGVTFAATGDAEVMGELVIGFAIAMLAGVLCVYAVLVLLLKDFLQPMTVLMALLLSIPGAFFALLITGSSLSMPSMIGLIMLMGITTKNSILLVDYIIIARHDHGYSRRHAIIDACRKRARPIVMTTIAMGAGMLPIALGMGADPSFRAPMAIVVIGGLITSTLLCLLVIPIIYSLVDDAIEFIKTKMNHYREPVSDTESGIEA